MFFWKKKVQVRRCPQGHQIGAEDAHCRYCAEDSSRVLFGSEMSVISSGDSWVATGAFAATEHPMTATDQDLSDSVQESLVPGGPPAVKTISDRATNPAQNAGSPDFTTVYDPAIHDLSSHQDEDVPPKSEPDHGAHEAQSPPVAATVETTRPQAPYRSAPGPVAWVVVANGPLRGCDFRLGELPARIGRQGGVEIRLDADPMISTRHAELRLQGGRYLLLDLGSTNGTKLNGRSVLSKQLRDGDRVRIGETDLIFKCVSI